MVRFRHRLVVACGATVALGALALASPVVGGRREPDAMTRPATDVAATAATLNGDVTPKGRTTYYFEYGAGDHALRTPVTVAGGGRATVAVSARVENLSPQTTYMARLVVVSHRQVVTGDDVGFTTPAAPPAQPAAPGSTPGTTPGTSPGTQPEATGGGASFAQVLGSQSGPPPQPVFGKTVAVKVRSGKILVKLPGSGRYVPLVNAASIPVGALVNARRGSITLRSALPDGHIQSGVFHGGLFEPRQPRGGRGLTELALRGRGPVCGATHKRRRRPARALWGNVRRGNFRTRGGASAATVRGTLWFVEDRCDGTLTRVTRGAVSVRDFRLRRTIIVRAGHRYLARRR